MSEERTTTLQLYLEIYVPGKEESLHWPMALTINESVKKVSEVMDYAHALIEKMMGAKRWMTIVDERYNHHIVMFDRVAGISILAPDVESIPWGVPEDTEDEEA